MMRWRLSVLLTVQGKEVTLVTQTMTSSWRKTGARGYKVATALMSGDGDITDGLPGLIISSELQRTKLFCWNIPPGDGGEEGPSDLLYRRHHPPTGA